VFRNNRRSGEDLSKCTVEDLECVSGEDLRSALSKIYSARAKIFANCTGEDLECIGEDLAKCTVEDL